MSLQLSQRDATVKEPVPILKLVLVQNSMEVIFHMCTKMKEGNNPLAYKV